MHDLSDCSIVIPVHIDFIERLEHVHFLYHYFDQNFINHQLIIVEAGVEPQIQLQARSHIQVEFVKSDREFSVAEVSNIGASLVNTPFFCKYDADALIHPKAIFDAFEILKTEPHQSLILPYNRISFSITNELRKKILQITDFRSLPFFIKEQAETVRIQDMYLKCQCSTGLIHHFRTAVFKELGGYNEEFIGWGFEDDEILNRFKTFGHPNTALENYNAFHLDHPRKEGDLARIFRKFCKKQALSEMPPEELRNYVKTWSRFI